MEVQGRIWIKENNKNFLGHGKVELLERIAESGSIAKAAREMKMSYKAAWDSIDMMNKISQQPLVLRATGGKGGGATQITEKGREAIKIFREMEEIQERLLKLFEVDLKGKVGEFDCELVEEFFRALVFNAGLSTHLIQKRGKNQHHLIEATFKAFGVALRRACVKNDTIEIPSTKGIL